jgi:heterodisulfide reductase subunit B
MRIGYYPGCSAGGTAIEYGLSIKTCAQLLNIDLIELNDWNCCGASSGHCTDATVALALPARNIAIAEQMDLPITVGCAACYLRFKTTEYELKHDDTRRAEIANLLEMPLAIKYKTAHFLELIYHQIGLEQLRKLVTRPLTGLKTACYYGCYLVRPAHITNFDNPENPTMLDEFMTTLGATAVDFPAKVDCCSGSLAFSRVALGKKLVSYIQESAIAAGANCIVAACPLCQANLDTRSGGSYQPLPILYFTELLALALGYPDTAVWWKRHIIRPNRLLQSINLS